MKRYDSFLIGHITNDESRDHLDHCERFYGGQSCLAHMRRGPLAQRSVC